MRFFTGQAFFLGYFLLQAFISQAQNLSPTLTHDLVYGRVNNEKDEGIQGKIEFFDPVSDKKVKESDLDANGEFKILLPKNQRYYFTIRSGYFTWFFKDDSHILETSTEKVPTEVELSFSVWQYSKGSSIILSDLNFATDRFEIVEAHKAPLDFLVAWLKKYPSLSIQVAGHTDNVGSDADNKKLSAQRAESVRAYLVETGGIAEERVSAYGYGSTRPLTSNETAEGKGINRRTSFIISKGE